jgi:predicted transcriptional regulator
MSLKKIQKKQEELARKLAELEKAEQDALAAAKKPIVEKVVNVADEVIRGLLNKDFDKISETPIRKADLVRTLRDAMSNYFALNDNQMTVDQSKDVADPAPTAPAPITTSNTNIGDVFR